MNAGDLLFLRSAMIFPIYSADLSVFDRVLEQTAVMYLGSTIKDSMGVVFYLCAVTTPKGILLGYVQHEWFKVNERFQPITG
jgi:hypothetical protein